MKQRLFRIAGGACLGGFSLAVHAPLWATLLLCAGVVLTSIGAAP